MEKSTTTKPAAADTAAADTANITSDSNSNDTPAAAPTAASSHSQNSLRSLNKSYKISKLPPSSSRNPTPTPTRNPTPNPPPPSSNPNPNPNLPSSPPVYNIDQSDFREIVQKLTGCPAHPQTPAPPPAAAAAPPPPVPATTSRRHCIRPPPLSNLSSLPPAVGPSLSPLPPLAHR